MPKLHDFFKLFYGKSNFSKKDIEENGKYPMITSKGTENGVWGYTNKKYDYCGVISIPRTGTVCHAFYQGLPCLINNDCIIADPINKLSEREMIYFSILIRQEKYKFSYSRKVTPQRIGNIDIPELIPDWVQSNEIPDFNNFINSVVDDFVLLSTKSWREFKYSEIFKIESGKGPTIAEAKRNLGDIPLITATEKNNGVSVMTKYEPQHPGNRITVAKNGSIGEAFYQPKEFCASSDVAVLELKYPLNKYIAMFLITLIKMEKYRYNYGLKWNLNKMKESKIKLPVKTNGQPDWEWTESYVKTLKYSSNL